VPLWEAAQRRLEHSGAGNRGRIRVETLPSEGRQVLAALLGRTPSTTVSLATVEAALVELGVGSDLPDALAALGHPVSAEPAARRAARADQRAIRDAARRRVGDEWPESWAGDWIDSVIRAGVLRGLDAAEAIALVDTVRRVLDELDGLDEISDGGMVVSRVDLAARVAGSAHALDAGSRLEAATVRALARRAGDDGAVEVWERAGVHTDLVSAPALTWALPLRTGSGLGALAAAAIDAAVPLHLSRLAMREHPVAVDPGTDVLVVENPRVVEAAAQRRYPGGVVALNGNPSSAVRLLVDQLLASGAQLRYHGDFDAPGLAICARMQRLGLQPWRMGAADYRDAVAAAIADGVELPVEDRTVPPTPWDPDLRRELRSHAVVVHEERLLDTILEPT
jgi:uncharacterized protein (TIGR02679 family)